MKTLYKGHRFPCEIISHTVWLYHRFTLSLLAIIGKRIFLDFRRPATGHANLVSGVGSAEMDRSSG